MQEGHTGDFHPINVNFEPLSTELAEINKSDLLEDTLTMSRLVVLATFSTILTTSSSMQSTQPATPMREPLITSTKSPTLMTLRTSLHGTAIIPDPLLRQTSK